MVSAFLGSELVEWLVRVGLARDRGEALLYGSRLHEGGVLQHITHDYSFQDDDLHYRFTERPGAASQRGNGTQNTYRDEGD